MGLAALAHHASHWRLTAPPHIYVSPRERQIPAMSSRTLCTPSAVRSASSSGAASDPPHASRLRWHSARRQSALMPLPYRGNRTYDDPFHAHDLRVSQIPPADNLPLSNHTTLPSRPVSPECEGCTRVRGSWCALERRSRCSPEALFVLIPAATAFLQWREEISGCLQQHPGGHFPVRVGRAVQGDLVRPGQVCRRTSIYLSTPRHKSPTSRKRSGRRGSLI